MNIIDVTDRDFDRVIAEHNLIVIDFWATWCGPCQSFKKVVATVAKKYSDVLFANVDIDTEIKLAAEFHIQSVPSIMILRNQVVVFAESGALTVSALSELIRQAQALDPEQLKAAADKENE